MDRASESANKKRVLLVVRWPVGGIRTFLRYVYSRFDPDKWHFTIIAPAHIELDALAKDLEKQDIDLVSTHSKPSIYRFGFEIFKQLSFNKYDFVHSHGFTSAVISAGPCMFFLKKHIVTSHDVLNKEQFIGLKGRLKGLLLSMVLSSAEFVHSVSHDAQANLLSFLPFLKNKNCVVIPNGIDTDSFLHSKAKKILFSKDIDGFKIGFFGRFMNQKGFRYLVDAIEILSKEKTLVKVPIVFAFGGGGFMQREKRDIESRGLSHYFRFMPFESNIAAAIKGMDVVVMPSLWEACGLLAMETLVCGTPLISTHCIGLREVIKNTPAIEIPASDSKALAEKIVYVMENDCLEMFRGFSQEAAQRFDVKKQALKINQLYNEILG